MRGGLTTTTLQKKLTNTTSLQEKLTKHRHHLTPWRFEITATPQIEVLFTTSAHQKYIHTNPHVLLIKRIELTEQS